jgi:hypothetical protein
MLQAMPLNIGIYQAEGLKIAQALQSGQPSIGSLCATDAQMIIR